MTSSPLPWSCDRTLDAAGVAAALAHNFQDRFLDAAITYFGAGWDNETYVITPHSGATGKRWLFRFPKRADCVPAMERELETLPVISDALSIAVPTPTFVGQPSDAFPYPFFGYDMIEGVTGDDLDFEVREREQLARTLGEDLRRLHDLTFPGLDLPVAGETFEARITRVEEDFSLLEEALGVSRAKSWAKQWREATLPPLYQGPPRFLHDDLGSSHMIFSPESKRLVGLIDFTDQALGAPERDLVGMLTWMGEPFVREIADAYGADAILPDDIAWERLRLSTLLAATRWLQDAQRAGEEMGAWRTWLHEQLAPMLNAMC